MIPTPGNLILTTSTPGNLLMTPISGNLMLTAPTPGTTSTPVRIWCWRCSIPKIRRWRNFLIDGVRLGESWIEWLTDFFSSNLQRTFDISGKGSPSNQRENITGDKAGFTISPENRSSERSWSLLATNCQRTKVELVRTKTAVIKIINALKLRGITNIHPLT